MSEYSSLSREELIARLESLEISQNPKAGPSSSPSDTRRTKSPSRGRSKPFKPSKPFEFNQHPTRHVALLVSYHGWPYSGLAIQPVQDLVETVESELLKALEMTRLIEEGKGWDGCGFSRCGRTDAGVSGAGQVVNLMIRSNKTQGVGWKPSSVPAKPIKYDENGQPIPRSDNRLEHSYPGLLNKVLPSSIKVLGWSPVPLESFDSRFSCTSRHYRYAFHLKPTPASPSLDLELMDKGAKLLIGEHDFRNFCKLDGSKQIQSHNRNVIDAYFAPDDSYPGLIVFNLIGSAFLWHQVRHIIAILLLIGSRLERPELILDLFDVDKYPGKPAYQMGHPLPLTLWDCAFKTSNLDWRVGGFDGDTESMTEEERVVENESRARLERSLEQMRQESELRSWQIRNAMDKVESIYGPPAKTDTSALFPTGGGDMLAMTKYHPVLTRKSGETPDEVNRKWREKYPSKVRREETADE